jgi:hypothetical protein
MGVAVGEGLGDAVGDGEGDADSDGSTAARSMLKKDVVGESLVSLSAAFSIVAVIFG